MSKKRKQALGPFQREWLRCLESGEFEQTTGALFRLNKKTGVYANCCLGVACLVAEANGVAVKIVDSGRVVDVDGNYASLPQPVVSALRFRGALGESRDSLSLSFLNDCGVDSFREIAAKVRAEPEQYFTGPA